jgi:hypothetical protein
MPYTVNNVMIANNTTLAYVVATMLPQKINGGDSLELTFAFDPNFYYEYTARATIYASIDTHYLTLHGIGDDPIAVHRTEIPLENAFFCSPNPAKSMTTLRWSFDNPTALPLSLEIIDPLGRSIRSIPIHASHGSAFVNTASLAPGLYFAVIRCGGIRYTTTISVL